MCPLSYIDPKIHKSLKPFYLLLGIITTYLLKKNISISEKNLLIYIESNKEPKFQNLTYKQLLTV